MAALNEAGLQNGRVVSDAYIVLASDLGQVLQIRGSSVTLPFGMQGGFYVTLINDGGGTISILTPQAALRSPLGGLAMTAQYETITVMRLFGGTNDWWTGQL